MGERGREHDGKDKGRQHQENEEEEKWGWGLPMCAHLGMSTTGFYLSLHNERNLKFAAQLDQTICITMFDIL